MGKNTVSGWTLTDIKYNKHIYCRNHAVKMVPRAEITLNCLWLKFSYYCLRIQKYR